jgi:signal transduction histidine kinase
MNKLENRRILLVDDMPKIHEDFHKILTDTLPAADLDEVEEALFGKKERIAAFQFELDSAFQGEEALAKVCDALEAARPYAMAFVDMRMPPGWDGVETIERIWQKDPLLQVVICTAYSDYSWEEVLGRLNARDRLLILKKPFDSIEVYQLASSLTAKWQMTQQATSQVSGLEEAVQKRTAELEESQAKLMDSARHAGMAEIATNILHNVGNVLNSVNISINVIAKTTRALKTDGLSKVVQMLDEHAGDLRDFLVKDDKGKLLPDYLKKVANSLAEEQNTILDELGQIAKSVDHIKEVVATQQSYAASNIAPQTVRITDLIEDALRMNAESFMRHQVTVVKEFADIPPLPLDKHRMLLIIINLISNAKQAMSSVTDRSHQITLRADVVNDKRLCIQVTDQGEGIAPEHMSRIFTRGYTTRKDGHGFGLHSCTLAAGEMNGTLTVHSEGLGKGATFTLEVPISDAGAAANAEKRGQEK